MELMIGQLAKRTGVSARMLRHYDDLGLFRPSRVGDNGYRWYDESTLPRLSRIIALRRAGMSLADIGGILEETSGEADALRRHLRELRAEAERLAALIATIEAQAERLDRARIDEPEQFRANYLEELDQLTERLKLTHPEAHVDAYAGYAQAVEAMPVTEIEHLVASSAELMTRLAELAAAGASPETPEARQGIAEHYRILTQTVPLSPEAYRSLGKMYTEDPLQRSIVEAFHPALPGWMTLAIESFT